MIIVEKADKCDRDTGPDSSDWKPALVIIIYVSVLFVSVTFSYQLHLAILELRGIYRAYLKNAGRTKEIDDLISTWTSQPNGVRNEE